MGGISTSTGFALSKGTFGLFRWRECSGGTSSRKKSHLKKGRGWQKYMEQSKKCRNVRPSYLLMRITASYYSHLLVCGHRVTLHFTGHKLWPRSLPLYGVDGGDHPLLARPQCLRFAHAATHTHVGVACVFNKTYACATTTDRTELCFVPKHGISSVKTSCCIFSWVNGLLTDCSLCFYSAPCFSVSHAPFCQVCICVLLWGIVLETIPMIL